MADRIVIIEALSMFRARIAAVVRRLAPGVPFGEGLEVSARMLASIPPQQVGRMLSGDVAADTRLVEDRGRPRK
jgi:hypothetical protein